MRIADFSVKLALSLSKYLRARKAHGLIFEEGPGLYELP